MSDRIEELRAAYNAAADDLADAAYAAYAAATLASAVANAADDADAAYRAADTYRAADAAHLAARRLWREAKAALEAAERGVRGE